MGEYERLHRGRGGGTNGANIGGFPLSGPNEVMAFNQKDGVVDKSATNLIRPILWQQIDFKTFSCQEFKTVTINIMNKLLDRLRQKPAFGGFLRGYITAS